MNYEIIIATTAPSAYKEVLTLQELHFMQEQCLNRIFIYTGDLFVVVGTKIIKFGVDESVKEQWALVFELKSFKESTVVEIMCDDCGRETVVKPENVNIFGVTIKTMLEDPDFAQVLVRLMKKEGNDLLPQTLQPLGHENCSGRERHHDGVRGSDSVKGPAAILGPKAKSG